MNRIRKQEVNFNKDETGETREKDDHSPMTPPPKSKKQKISTKIPSFFKEGQGVVLKGPRLPTPPLRRDRRIGC